MFCRNCGAKISDGNSFCGKCGQKTIPNNVPSGTQGVLNPPLHNNAPVNDVFNPPARTNGNKSNKILIVVLAVWLVIIFGIVAFFAIKNFTKDDSLKEKSTTTAENNLLQNNSSNSSAKMSQNTQPQNQIQQKAVYPDLDDVLDDWILSHSSHSSIGVAIMDNQTSEIYTSQSANNSYVAWGWYLPVYLVYSNQSPYNSTVANGIMSSDAGTCNNSANTAIRNFGGPSGITRAIQNSFGVTNTEYGRYFGDTNAASDNYTTPREAVMLLNHLDGIGSSGKLCYNLSSFYISAPAGVSVYAQAGTENRNVRNALNLFAVVKGPNTDYSIAIMTKNGAGVHISELLSFINAEMELRAK